ncbi:hypothetical protein AZ09_08170 [Acetobacter aceti 1023]|nr:hypothetical protein AZ09_08170 [Acetobacter aceti 1023]
MIEMRRPTLKEFNRTDIPARACVRLLSYEQRGVLEDMTQALKKMRSCVFMCGPHKLTDAEVIQVALVREDIFTRVLPQLIQRGFLARDDEGALFSPHLYDRLLRKEEREAVKAEADARWQQMQENCDVPEGMTRQQMANKKNAQMAGRPRKGESREQAFERRQREQAQKRQQPHLLMPISGTKAEIENRNGKSKQENSINSISIDLELERDNNIPSSSISGEIENPALAQEQVAQTVARVIATTGMNDQAPYAVSLVRRWMGQGAEPDTIISAIREHTEAMRKNGEEPRRLKVFEAAVLRGIEVQHLRPKAQDTAPEKPQAVKENAKFEQAWAKAAKVWKDAFTDCRDFGAVKRRWPELAQENGLPPVPFEKTAYQQHFMHQQSAQVAA